MEMTIPTVLVDMSMSNSLPLFTRDELNRAIVRLLSGKAPSPDLIPNEVIKLAANRHPSLFLDTYNSCLTDGIFPSRWKRAKLVLLFKGQRKLIDSPSSYRPISLLDGAGKVLERLLLNRLEAHLESVIALNDSQHGFRRARSTFDAIEEVQGIARVAGSGSVQYRCLCAVITIDVRNAFNIAPWELIDAALRKSSVPTYLTRILRSYMSDRWLILGGTSSSASPRLPVLCGVPQGSVLGPTLWNLFYNSLLKIPIPDGAKLVAFADDVALVVVAQT